MSGKAPSFQFYPKDWQADHVAGCSLAAQGLWLRMMIQMHNSERYGYLSQHGLPIPDEAVARYCGCPLQEYQTLLAELERAGVPSRTPEGIIYSRRMVRDEKKRSEWRGRQDKHRHASVTPVSRPSPDLHSASANLKQKPALRANSFQAKREEAKAESQVGRGPQASAPIDGQWVRQREAVRQEYEAKRKSGELKGVSLDEYRRSVA